MTSTKLKNSVRTMFYNIGKQAALGKIAIDPELKIQEADPPSPAPQPLPEVSDDNIQLKSWIKKLPKGERYKDYNSAQGFTVGDLPADLARQARHEMDQITDKTDQGSRRKILQKYLDQTLNTPQFKEYFINGNFSQGMPITEEDIRKYQDKKQADRIEAQNEKDLDAGMEHDRETFNPSNYIPDVNLSGNLNNGVSSLINYVNSMTDPLVKKDYSGLNKQISNIANQANSMTDPLVNQDYTPDINLSNYIPDVNLSNYIPDINLSNYIPDVNLSNYIPEVNLSRYRRRRSGPSKDIRLTEAPVQQAQDQQDQQAKAEAPQAQAPQVQQAQQVQQQFSLNNGRGLVNKGTSYSQIAKQLGGGLTAQQLQQYAKSNLGGSFMAGRTYDFNKIKNEISGNTNFMQPKAPKYVPPKNTQVGNMLNTLKQNQNKPPQMRQISSPMMPQQKPNFSNVINTINKAQNP